MPAETGTVGRPTPRSYLYVPGNAPDKLHRALGRGADALIVDLEDAVPPAAKENARAAVATWLKDLATPSDVEIWVRINPGQVGLVDASAVVSPALSGVVAAKTESRAGLSALDEVLGAAEEAAGLDRRSIPVTALLESAAAVLDAASIATGPRVARLQLGEADLRADIGITVGEDEREMLYLRSHVVLVSAARALAPPTAPVSTNFRDLDAFRVSTRALAQLGFVGRGCIHPAQIQVVNEVFTPGEQELARARDLVARFDAAVEAGQGVLVDDAGRMVDEAVVRQARRLLARAR